MDNHPFTESLIKTSFSTMATLRLRIALASTSSTARTSTTPPPRPFSLFSATSFTLACITFLALSTLSFNNNPSSLSNLASAAPAKHTLAPENLLHAMEIKFSDTAALPLQLQIESQVRGIQKLAYLPTTGPSMDFYYLNYRPTYHAGGDNKIDFWMLTPEGSPAPRTGSLELFDEFGKVRLAVLVPEGTEIPQAVANKNQPFLWKSWKIPQSLGSEFDFSEKFRVVLKTSDHIAAANKAKANAKNKNNNEDKDKQKRQFFDDAGLVDFLLVKNKNKHVTTADNASTLSSMGAGPMVVQDRQLRIKGLTATPGGKPNPAKLTVNSVLPVAAPKANANTNANTKANTEPASTTTNDSPKGDDNTVKVDKPSSSETNNGNGNVHTTGARSAASPNAHLLPQFTALLAIVLSATMGVSFC
ncbi:hypothetical protein EC991_001333 [Linnemannia zychae]|nr:hypothetical protein EC991_001333 [Linnemannia zychae]